jgi:hypothetical protein
MNFHGRLINFICAVALLLGVKSTSLADYIPPELVKVSTSKVSNQTLVFNPGKYSYTISWQGIPVASADIVLGESPQLNRVDYTPHAGDVTMRVSAKTGKVISLLYKLRHTSESTFNLPELRPIAFTSDQTENSKYRRTEILFSPNHSIASRIWKQPGDSVPSETSEFTSESFTLDPLFGALIARSLPVDMSTHTGFDVWNGKHRYLITFKVEGQDYIEIGKNKVLADRVVPNVQKLTDSEGEKRIKSCKMWVSADDRREILKVESKVLVGSITATLKGIEALPTPMAPVIQVAEQPNKDSSGRAMLEIPKN